MNPIRILIVEDNEDDTLLTITALREYGYAPTYERVEDPQALTAALQRKWDCVISDFSMPHFNGIEALRITKSTDKNLPFILVSGTIGESTAVAAMKAGVADYLMKDNLARLGPAIEREIAEAAMRREKEKAEANLLESERKYRALVNEIHEGVFITDEHGVLTFANEALAKIYGRESASAMIGSNLMDFVLLESREILETNFQIMIDERHDAHRPTEMIIIKPNGERAVVFHHPTIIVEKGRVIGTRGIVIDITERKRNEEQLRLQSAALESADNAIVIMDRNGMTKWINKAYTRLTGYKYEEVIGNNARDLLKSGVQNASFFKDLWQTILGGEVWRGEIVNRHKDGHIYVEEQTITPVFDERGLIQHFIAIKQDITEKKRSEDALRRSEEQFRLISENVSDLIAVLDLNGQRIYNSPSYKIIFDNPASMCGTDSFLEIHPDDRSKIRAVFQDTVKTGIGHRAEYRFLLKNGAIRHIESQGSVIRDSKGNITSVVVVSRDVTNKKSLEQQLIQAQKLESLGTLASGIAHDFNNILAIIMGHSTLLERINNSDSEKYLHSINGIIQATKRGAKLVKQLLTFARKTEIIFNSVNINQIIDEITTLLDKTFPKTIIIETALQQDLPAMLADASQIHQIFLNLCVNARDAMPKGGTLSISTSVIDGAVLCSRFAKASEQRYIQIDVSDTGIGMDEVTQQRIFEPFFTTKSLDKGTGLGLALVFGIVESHRGIIEVKSRVGSGTTFTLYLPIAEQPPENPPPDATAIDEIKGGTETILLVEDEEAIAKFLNVVLRIKGYKVISADDGIQGLEIYRKRHQEIDLVITDIGLPRLSGDEMFKRVLEIDPNEKVIMTSGYIDPDIKSQLYRSGVKNFVEKPYSHIELLRKIREVLDLDQ